MPEFNHAALTDFDHRKAAALAAVDMVREATDKKKLVVVFGNGVVRLRFFRIEDWLESIQRTASAEARTGKPFGYTQQDGRRLVWRHHERLRDHSQNYLPPTPLLYLFGMLRLGLASLAITPNYDRHINSLFEKWGEPYSWNPVENDKNQFGDSYGSQAVDSPVLWKYHGDVGFARFDTCGHVFGLPNFTVEPMLPLNPRLQKIQPSPGVQGLVGNNQRHFMHTKPHPTGWPAHYIDFNFEDKGIFQSEINGAVDAIRGLDESNTAGFIIVGFAGRWARDKELMSEEIVPEIIRKNQAGIPATMIFLPTSQDQVEESHLARALWDKKNTQLWTGDATQNLRLLIENCPSLHDIRNEDAFWMNRNVFALEPRQLSSAKASPK